MFRLTQSEPRMFHLPVDDGTMYSLALVFILWSNWDQDRLLTHASRLR